MTATAKPLILVVDDEESMRWFLERTLRREGYDVASAPDGPSAIAAAQHTPPSLVLADVRMPGMDGVALLRALKTVIPGVPVVLMTAYGAVEDALHAMKQGAVDYVTKPFRVEQIRDVISKALAGSSRAPTLRDLPAPGAAASSASGASSSGDAAAAASRPSGPQTSQTTASAALAAASAGTGLAAFLRDRVAHLTLPVPPELTSGDLDLRGMTRLAETVYVDELLRLTDGNVSRAADIAGITRPNLHRKIQDLGLSADAYRGR